MTTAAWVMMLTTWSVIISFTGYFFARVLAKPQSGEGPDEDTDPDSPSEP